MRHDTLPSNYSSPRSVRIFSNKAENVQILFLVDRHVPVLIGERLGKPRVWITAPVKMKTGEARWFPVVRNNLAVHPAFEVKSDEDGKVVTIHTSDRDLLKVRSLDGVFDVLALDLRPIGLNIYGDKNGLRVGEMIVKDNDFINLQVMVSNHQHTEPSPAELARQAKRMPKI